MTGRVYSLSFWIKWRPELRFYEEGVSLLRSLDSTDDLSEFKVDLHEVRARLASGPIVVVRSDGLTVSTPGPLAEFDDVVALLDEIQATLAPIDMNLGAIALITLAPINGLRDEACRKLAHLGAPAGSNFARAVTDTAILTDGYHDDNGRQVKFQVEFGVVGPVEGAERLDRTHSSRLGSPGEGVVRTAIDADVLAAANLFAEWRWSDVSPPTSLMSEYVEAITKVVEVSDDYGGELLALFDYTMGGDS